MKDLEMIKALRRYNAEIAARFEELKREQTAYKIAYKSASTKLARYKQLLGK